MNTWSLPKKLIAMLTLPLLGLGYFAVSEIVRKVELREQTVNLERQAEVAVEASALVHELQLEEGLSVAYLAGGAGQDSGALLTQYGRTDEMVDAFQQRREGAADAGALSAVVEKTTDRGVQALDGLRTLRDRVRAGDASTQEVIDGYSQIDDRFLAILPGLAQTSSRSEDTFRLLALDSLVREAEEAGIERAVIRAALSSAGGGTTRSSEDLRRQAVRLHGRQELLETLFEDYAPSDLADSYQQRVGGDGAAQLAALRRQLLDGESLASVDPQAWWNASTSFIDTLSDLRRDLEQDILATTGELRNEATRGLWIAGLLTLVLAGAAVAISIVIARGLSRTLISASVASRDVAEQILVSTRQFSASTSETATAVSQTATTVDEIQRASEMASTKAEEMSSAATDSRSASEEALDAINRGIEAMGQIRQEVEGIAQSILDLSEKNIRIGEIVQSVNDIAEQSNLLAVNASIEAAKAQEQGRGFAVVATEVKELAQQAKEATDQIRVILAEVQKSSNSSVMTAEQGVKRVEEGTALVEELGQAIRRLAQVIEDSSDKAGQISLSAGQQMAGIGQISEAIRNIEQATKDNAQGADQLKQAAEQLTAASNEVSKVVNGIETAA